MSGPPRIYLSTPHVMGREREFVDRAIASNWIAPLGPEVDAFERELALATDTAHCAALASGTAALHLALQLVGVERGDQVWTSDLTFVASVNAARYLGAEPVFFDCDRASWTLDAALLEEELDRAARAGTLPAAVVAVDLYGQCCDYERIAAACTEHGVPLVEDAAEALGARYGDRRAGCFGDFGVLSFNGNKIITTSGGGALVADDPEAIARARFLASQAREPAPHYEHAELGYNYRMSNVLAALGRAQLETLEQRIAARRRNFDRYVELLGDLPGVDWMPEASWGLANRWLTCLTVDPERFGADRESVRLALEAENIEARPVWKPMHLQPLYRGCRVVGGEVGEELFERGLCLPSGSDLEDRDLERIAGVVRGCCRDGGG